MTAELAACPHEEATPRRRFAVCPHLAIDDQPATIDSSRQYKHKGWHIDRSGQTFTCPHRPTVAMSGWWVADLCLSSWHRGCAFLPDDAPSSPARAVLVATFAAGYGTRRAVEPESRGEI